ncbi:MAG TPA: TonB-dependent receptor plug domain-containing protein, partial [Flavobacteriaceae bacterium]|nr:TonB-dependent receptor plug domain-containing protein [Flavobacteriaceae bacterium]
MKKNNVFFAILCSMSICGFAQQEADSTKVQELDEVVITDSKFKLKRENSGKVITKITQKELQNLQGKTISEIINTTAGIEINGTKSSASQNLNYYVRGGRNRQVLVLIDGVALTDPSQIANDYDLRLINADQVESIEILKGASSTLYGSGAATAVINIKLKEASKEKISANFRSTIGTNKSQSDDGFSINDFKNSVLVNGTLNKFDYLASFGNQYT